VELALKAVIAGSFQPGVIPDKKSVARIYTHDLSELVELANLGEERKRKPSPQPLLSNWDIVNQWSEASRYDIIDELRARDLLEAIGDPQGGVFPWITCHW
jgi:hypothetical protein